MAELFKLTSHVDSRGILTVAERQLSFFAKRVFYIYDVPVGTERGGHRHLKTKLALIAISGKITITTRVSGKEEVFDLNSPELLLYLAPSDWHIMKFCSPGAILLVLASEEFDSEDYIYEPII